MSPTTAALWAGCPFRRGCPSLNVLLLIVPGAAGVGHENRCQHAGDKGTGQQTAQGVGPKSSRWPGGQTPSAGQEIS